jgi:hypothetical protein
MAISEVSLSERWRTQSQSVLLALGANGKLGEPRVSKVSTWNILWNKASEERSQVRRLQTHGRPSLLSSWSCWFQDRFRGDRVVRSPGNQELSADNRVSEPGNFWNRLTTASLPRNCRRARGVLCAPNRRKRNVIVLRASGRTLRKSCSFGPFESNSRWLQPR